MSNTEVYVEGILKKGKGVFLFKTDVVSWLRACALEVDSAEAREALAEAADKLDQLWKGRV